MPLHQPRHSPLEPARQTVYRAPIAMRHPYRSLALALALGATAIAAAPSAQAFCGFYVAGADDPLTSRTI